VADPERSPSAACWQADDPSKETEVERRRDDDRKAEKEAPAGHAPRAPQSAEEAPRAAPRRSSIVRRDTGRPDDMGDWVIDEVE